MGFYKWFRKAMAVFGVPSVTGGSMTITGSQVIEANSASDALRVTQEGAGNVFVAEDSANPDSTPFVIDTDGKVIIGHTEAISVQSINAAHQLHGTDTDTSSKSNVRWSANSGNPVYTIGKSRGASIGTNGLVAFNDILGEIRFVGDDGTGFKPAASIVSKVNGTPSAGSDMPGSLVFSTTPNGTATLAERLMIDNAGAMTAGEGITTFNATAIPAGGTAGSGYKFSSTSNFGTFFGSGAPTLAAAQGSLYLRSDGDRPYVNTTGSTVWSPLVTENTFFIAAKDAVAKSLIEPATTFTSATPSSAAAGADTLLTSAGAHGLTSAVAVGVPIFISAGTGWPVGFHTITAIAVDTTGTTIQIDTPFDAGFGTPTIALADTEVTLSSVAIPTLEANSIIRMDISVASPDTSATQKRWIVRLDAANYLSVGLSTAPSMRRTIVIHNRNATNSQVGGLSTAPSSGEGSSISATPTSSIDTSVATTITIVARPAGPNIPMTLDRHFVEVFK